MPYVIAVIHALLNLVETMDATVLDSEGQGQGCEEFAFSKYPSRRPEGEFPSDMWEVQGCEEFLFQSTLLEGHFQTTPS